MGGGELTKKKLNKVGQVWTEFNTALFKSLLNNFSLYLVDVGCQTFVGSNPLRINF